MPRPKRPYVVGPEDARVVRADEYAIIEYDDPGVIPVAIKLGDDIDDLDDDQILDRYNWGLIAMEESDDGDENVAVEIPVGRPQVEHLEEADQWVTRGEVLRCVISDASSDPDDSVSIWIDDREFSERDFGRLLATMAGWGMRVVFTSEEHSRQKRNDHKAFHVERVLHDVPGHILELGGGWAHRRGPSFLADLRDLRLQPSGNPVLAVLGRPRCLSPGHDADEVIPLRPEVGT